MTDFVGLDSDRLRELGTAVGALRTNVEGAVQRVRSIAAAGMLDFDPGIGNEIAQEAGLAAVVCDTKATAMELAAIGIVLPPIHAGSVALRRLEISLDDHHGFQPPTPPHFGIDAVVVPSGAETASFEIPVWEGLGVTRLQYFIADDEVCLSGTGPDIACGSGDDRSFVSGDDVADYDVPVRVRIVLDHEVGEALVVAYPTHDGEGGEMPALPIELEVDGPVELPIDYPSSLRVWTHGDGIDDNIVFDYRFLNSMTPSVFGGVAPAINGAIRVQRDGDEVVVMDGKLAQYPSVEIMRDVETSGDSRIIFTKRQESGGPLNLLEPGEDFDAEG